MSASSAKITDRGQLSTSRSRPDSALARSRRSLGQALPDSTVATAIFDQNLCCLAANLEFATLPGAGAETCTGKTLPEILKTEVPQFDGLLRQVWRSQRTLRGQILSVRTRAGSGGRFWLVDLFPIRDTTESVRAIGAAFSEITANTRMERRLSRLSRRRAPDGNAAWPPATGEHESCLELLQRTTQLLHHSMALRRAISEVKLRATLGRQAVADAADGLPFLFAGTDAKSALEAFHASLPQAVPEQSAPELPPATGNGHLPPNAGNTSHPPSPREMQVVRFLADGKTNKEIASLLHLSTRTVEVYRSRLMAKLKLRSVAEVVRYAIRNNLVPV